MKHLKPLAFIFSFIKSVNFYCILSCKYLSGLDALLAGHSFDQFHVSDSMLKYHLLYQFNLKSGGISTHIT